MSRNKISRITSRIDDLTERLGPRRITVVGEGLSPQKSTRPRNGGSCSENCGPVRG
jgi:hypothetical protein